MPAARRKVGSHGVSLFEYVVGCFVRIVIKMFRSSRSFFGKFRASHVLAVNLGTLLENLAIFGQGLRAA